MVHNYLVALGVVVGVDVVLFMVEAVALGVVCPFALNGETVAVYKVFSAAGQAADVVANVVAGGAVAGALQHTH